jgi:hypothetical protein
MGFRRKLVREVWWALGVLVVGGLLYSILLASNIPYSTGAEEPEPPPAAPTSTAQTVAAAVEPPSAGAIVTGIRSGPDDRSLFVQIQVPANPDCVRDTRIIYLSESADAIHANVVYSLLRPEKECRDTAPAEVPLKTSAPIGDRRVVLNSSVGEPWNKIGDGWGHCDSYLGCNPPPDHCFDGRIGQLVFSADIEGDGTKQACDQDWLILDLNRHHGDPNIRVLYRWQGDGWSSYLRVRQGGCGEILAAEPKFPVTLCEKLTPPT